MSGLYTPGWDETFSVRFSTPSDVGRIIRFQTDNVHTYVLTRKHEEYLERARHGAAVMVENSRGDMVACSLSYPLHVDHGRNRPAHIWTEMGSTRIVLNGFKLYQLLVAATTLQQFLMQPPEDRFVAEVDIPNTAVHKMLGGDLKWTPFTQTPEALPKASHGTVDNHDGQPVIWYQCGIEHMPHQARVVQEYIRNPVITRFNKAAQPQAVGQIRLDFSRFQLAHMFSNYLSALAGQNFGDPARPDPALGLLDARSNMFNSDQTPTGQPLHHSHHGPRHHAPGTP
jgi:hypothetical protein